MANVYLLTYISTKYLKKCFPYITALHLGKLNSAFLNSYRLVGLSNKAWRGFGAKLFLALYMGIAISCNPFLHKVDRFDFSNGDS